MNGASDDRVLRVRERVGAEWRDAASAGTRIPQVGARRNLISNALKFTPAGGRVLLEVKLGDAGFVIVDVIDTGVGISKEHVDKVFDRLYQVSRDDATSRGGLGIGLSLCREIVVMHGGTISVTSTPGQGSTFSVSFPTLASSELAA